MESFVEYVNEQTLIDFVVKERVKCATNRSLPKTLPKKSQTKEGLSDILKRIQSMTPPRNKWRRLRQRSRNGNIPTAVLNRNSLKSTICFDLKKYRKYGAEAPEYLVNLLNFFDEIYNLVDSDGPLDFNFSDCAKVIAKFKKNKGDTAIYRPLSVYSSLHAKTLISLASEYLTKALDDKLHTEILAYRPKRDYHEKVNYSTKPDDAIWGLRKFMADHPGQQMYVAECDIQKFYDVLNHDVVLQCFMEIAEEAQIPNYHKVERILKAYLDSYSFPKDIMSLNDDKNFWNIYKAKQKNPKEFCRFEWVSDDCFKTCYESEEQLQGCKHLLGVPQGGALSCIVANVVLNSVDKVVLAEDDPNRFFVRYGDDILLAHTDYQKCCQLMDAYVKSLERHHLPYHPFVPLSEFKQGAKITKDYWDMKSKSPFLWGSGEGNASEWIGFVGYEVKYTGETRIRKTTLDKKFNAINKKYHECFLKETPKNFHRFMQSNRRKLAGLNSSLAKMAALKRNSYSIQQAKSLDRYRLHKIEKLQRKLTNKFRDLAIENCEEIDLAKIFVINKEASRDKSFYWKLHDISKNQK